MNTKSLLFCMLCAPALLVASSQAAALDGVQILSTSDRARGGGLPGVEWTLKITSTDPETEDVRDLTVKAIDDSSLAESTYPPRVKGAKLLQVGHNMWYGRPDLRKPISISARQRMMGQAVNGDIASTNYIADYVPTLLREEPVDGEAAYVLDLSGKSKWVTYDRVVYWVSKARMVALKAEYYTVSGKLIKTARFEYANAVTYKDRTTPFISKMTIRDAINSDNYSVLEYSNIKVRALPRSEFAVAELSQ